MDYPVAGLKKYIHITHTQTHTICMYVHMFICSYVCIYVRVHTHLHTETNLKPLMHPEIPTESGERRHDRNTQFRACPTSETPIWQHQHPRARNLHVNFLAHVHVHAGRLACHLSSASGCTCMCMHMQVDAHACQHLTGVAPRRSPYIIYPRNAVESRSAVDAGQFR